jgi:uncharacterized membrane protein YuzA (DUF378 family)
MTTPSTSKKSYIYTTRLVLSGALLGIAVVGVFTHFPYNDIVGAVFGAASVFAAKATHII